MTAASAILLTTCHLGKDGTADLKRLVDSISVALRGGELERLRHVVLLQGCSGAQREDVAQELPDWVELLSNEGGLSSPAARNRMIDHVLAGEELDQQTFIAFPDDDAWYPPGALACIARQFGTLPKLKLLVTRYGPAPSAARCGEAFRPSFQQALSRGACAAIFVRAGMLRQLRGFHELLGLGTELSGGEDTEFVHRGFHQASGQVMCVPGALVGHAAADPRKKVRYFEGGLAALWAHRHASTAAQVALVRKLAVGAALVFRRRLTPREFHRAIGRARARAPAIRQGGT